MDISRANYRQLNNETKKDSYRLPRIYDKLHTLSGAKISPTLELKSGYWQVATDPVDAEKISFTIDISLWQFAFMVFGLCNAPLTYFSY